MPTEENERDMHFQGFAKLLLDRLKPDLAMLFTDLARQHQERIDKDEKIIKTVIAQAAYDFAWHVIGCVGGGFEANHYLNDEDILRDLEDMPQWPRRENADETQQSET